ncbi:hypothetical protein OM076_26645 [Solirubrobacter ginsenosidimutans]|uniref:Uncharacterized protein n=1 Tax=Solirubrobacter ginsenosidimutans TaxID=490573 RepID=A0A9X3MYV6_9ACTN|nr:hypothetical protein [Solirubrobacter ginsenosidimutans]MDA0163878.1 hypothetical protein [Solirubrobacter ginsenosidimutans]
MRRLVLVLTLAAVAVFGARAALAQVGGKTYTGTHDAGRGGKAEFQVSADGKRVVAYSFPAVDGDTCSFVAKGDEGVWDGAAIGADGRFIYTFYDRIELSGRFDGRTATGTIRLRRVASSGASACDTGAVAWSVATPGEDAPPLPGATPTPEPSDPGSGSGGSSPNPGGGSTPKRRTILASVAVHRDARKISGRLNASERTCRSKRKLTLKRGSKVLARTTSRTDGTFAFSRSAKTRNQRVRVTVASVTRSKTLTCGASTSALIRG